MWKIIAASLVFMIATGVATADEFVGFVTTFEDGKMTVKKSKGTEHEEVTVKFAHDVKIVKGKVNPDTMKIEAGEDFEGGKDAFARQVKETAEKVKKWTEAGKKGFGLGVFVSIVTEGDKVSEIRVTGGGKKKQDK